MTIGLTSCVQCHELEWFKYDNNEKFFTNYSLNDMLGLSPMGPPWWALSTFEGKARGLGPNLKGFFTFNPSTIWAINPGIIWASGPDGTRIELKGTFKVWSWIRFLGTPPLKRQINNIHHGLRTVAPQSTKREGCPRNRTQDQTLKVPFLSTMVSA